jgi:hypothetical protein
MPYRCVATTMAGFIQQLAVAYVSNGYWFYVTGRIPDGKDPAQIDQRIIDRYCIDVSKWTRARRKKLGLANVQYLRYLRFFVIVASRGEHPFFEAEGSQIRDIRRKPLGFSGYSIGCCRGRGGGRLHASVRIQRQVCRQLKEKFVARALQPTVEEIVRDLRGLDYEPYARVRYQLRGILRAVNSRRETAGLELVPWQALRQRRSPLRPFE